MENKNFAFYATIEERINILGVIADNCREHKINMHHIDIDNNFRKIQELIEENKRLIKKASIDFFETKFNKVNQDEEQ